MGEGFRGPGGGSPIARVKDYASVNDLPVRGRPGDFAVVTDTKIGGCTISLSEPPAAPGAVWIGTGDLADIAIVAGKNPSLEIRPWLVRQYVNEAWTIMPAYVWAEGWQPLDGIQFYQGVLKNTWTFSASSGASAAISGTVIRMNANSDNISYKSAYLTASNMPLQSAQKLHVLYDKSGGGGKVRIDVAGKTVYSNNATVSNHHAVVSLAEYSAGTIQIYLTTGWDINSGASASAVIYKVWFE